MPQLGVLEIEGGLEHVRCSPANDGRLDLIVRRRSWEEREVVEEAYLDVEVGLVGDSWQQRLSTPTPDGPPIPRLTDVAMIAPLRRQVAIINSRFSRLIAGDAGRRPLSGDQLHVDLDLSVANLSVGDRLCLGGALIEITPKPHTGCRKFSARYGADALRVVKSQVGQELRLRGAYARVIESGAIRHGDTISIDRLAR